jgi:carboxypeptidase C (cathepsin A)
MVDNPDTLLTDSDLVFMDPVETGFSRPAKPEFAPEFLQFQGDVAATVEFIRSYRARFRANEQPVFIAGESYGVFRGAAVVDELIRRGVKVAGTILISGDIPNIPQPPEFYDAMHVPARTATAFFYKRLPPALMHDRDATIKEALAWARNVYQPALARKDQLTDAEREKLAQDLALYTGISANLVDRKTLVVPVNVYLAQFLGGDLSRALNPTDTRVIDSPTDPGASSLLDRYLRDELQYSTDLTYRGVEQGYMPSPGPKAQSTSDQFYFNQSDLAAEGWEYYNKTGEIAELARVNPPWIVKALKRDKDMWLFVLTGRYDPLNMCEGNVILTAELSSDISSRIINRCYESGHSIYKDEAARLEFSHDVSNFIRETVARQAR